MTIESSLTYKPYTFNPATTAVYALLNASYVRPEVFNIVGQKVAVLEDGQYQAGVYSFDRNISDDDSGIYLYSLTIDDFSQARKMSLMK